MKILFLNYYDFRGGAAIATFRLLKALQKKGVDVKMGVVEKTINDKAVINLCRTFLFDKKPFSLIKKIINRMILPVKRIAAGSFQSTNKILHSQNKKTKIDKDYINNSDYDIIHLHWINNDMISIKDISKIKKPLVWTMHDSWVFCGAEHHPNILENDDRFVQGYNSKNKPKTSKGPDLCLRVFNQKKRWWKTKKIHFIAPSRFEKEMFEQSALFRHSPCSCAVIPNLLSGDIFKPRDKKMVRAALGMDSGKQVIGFGAAYQNDPVKGSHYLLAAIEKLDAENGYSCLVFGETEASFAEGIKIPLFESGKINNHDILAALYNACDVFVCPSMIENLPNVCLEALFCGIPVAAFRTGGIPDIVEHKKTGYLAEPYDTGDLYRGILYCLDNYEELSRSSVKKAAGDFNSRDTVNKHIKLYEEALKS